MLPRAILDTSDGKTGLHVFKEEKLEFLCSCSCYLSIFRMGKKEESDLNTKERGGQFECGQKEIEVIR